MQRKVAATIRRYNLLAPGQPVFAAVSGGADSLCLFLVLQSLGYPVAIAHVNHGLRGAESEADEAFVRSFATEQGVLFRNFRIQLGPGNMEEVARNLRYEALASLLEPGSDHRVALGHTLSDQAETVLFRFLRGSGTAGIAAIWPATTAGFIRPLIETSREEVEEYLRTAGVSWREDSSNCDETLARNRIRHQLLPQLTAEWNPALPQTLARTAEIAHGEEDYWAGEVSRFEQRFLRLEEHCVVADASALRECHTALCRRVIRRAIELTRGNLRQIDFQHVEAVRMIALSGEGHGRVILPGVDVMRSYDCIRFAIPEPQSLQIRNAEVSCSVPGVFGLPGAGSCFSLQLQKCTSRYNQNVDTLDWDQCTGPLKLRNWLPGDAYARVDENGRSQPVSKLKKLFEQDRIPLWQRRSWPVLSAGDRIVWSRQFGPAHGVEVTHGTQTILCIREIKQAALVNESETRFPASM